MSHLNGPDTNYDKIRTLREHTGAGIVACKKALYAAKGDLNDASELLAQQGEAAAAKLADRPAEFSRVGVYVHGDGQLAAMVRIGCNTDFVARSDEMIAFANQLAMQAVAVDARSVTELLESASMMDETRTIEQMRVDITALCRENITVLALSRA